MIFHPRLEKAFTLIELLVVIAIIGILATLALLSVNSAKTKARDSKRLADVKQMQTALEIYYNGAGAYPSSWTAGQPLIDPSTGNVIMAAMPSNPQPWQEGACATNTNANYGYSYTTSTNAYTITYCLAGNTNNYAGGRASAIPYNIHSAPPPSSACDAGVFGVGATITDVRPTETNVYDTVWLDTNGDGIQDAGDQCWLKENMHTASFPDGTSISYSPTATYGCVGCYTCPPNLADNDQDCTAATNIGYLYSFYGVLNLPSSCWLKISGQNPCPTWIGIQQQGICPAGWHIPTYAEWTSAINTAENLALNTTGASCGSGTCTNAGAVLKEASTNYWTTLGTPTANNTTGFSARGSGYWYPAYEDRNVSTLLAVAGEGNLAYAYTVSLNASNANVINAHYLDKGGYLAVRCLKN